MDGPVDEKAKEMRWQDLSQCHAEVEKACPQPRVCGGDFPATITEGESPCCSTLIGALRAMGSPDSVRTRLPLRRSEVLINVHMTGWLFSRESPA